MIVQELVSSPKAPKSKPTLKDVLFALEEGQEPDAKTVKALERLMAKAEKAMLNQVLDNPDNFGIDYEESVRTIRSGTHIHTTHVRFGDEGLEFMMRVDTDDIGGDSDNAEDLCLDYAGNVVRTIGQEKGLLYAQDGFVREE